MVSFAGLIVAMFVGALMAGVVAYSYIISQSIGYDAEIDDLNRELAKLQATGNTVPVFPPNAEERRELSRMADERLSIEFESYVSTSIRVAINLGSNVVSINVADYPSHIIDDSLSRITDDYKFDKTTDRTLVISWDS